MNAQELIDTARTLVAGDKGLLAMDESNPTCNKRFAALGIPQTEEARRAYRELIVTTPGLGEYISGVILYDETIRQQKKDGTPFVKVITDVGIILASVRTLINGVPSFFCWRIVSSKRITPLMNSPRPGVVTINSR